jgi:hypothetical protein
MSASLRLFISTFLCTTFLGLHEAAVGFQDPYGSPVLHLKTRYSDQALMLPEVSAKIAPPAVALGHLVRKFIQRDPKPNPSAVAQAKARIVTRRDSDQAALEAEHLLSLLDRDLHTLESPDAAFLRIIGDVLHGFSRADMAQIARRLNSPCNLVTSDKILDRTRMNINRVGRILRIHLDMEDQRWRQISIRAEDIRERLIHISRDPLPYDRHTAIIENDRGIVYCTRSHEEDLQDFYALEIGQSVRHIRWMFFSRTLRQRRVLIHDRTSGEWRLFQRYSHEWIRRPPLDLIRERSMDSWLQRSPQTSVIPFDDLRTATKELRKMISLLEVAATDFHDAIREAMKIDAASDLDVPRHLPGYSAYSRQIGNPRVSSAIDGLRSISRAVEQVVRRAQTTAAFANRQVLEIAAHSSTHVGHRTATKSAPAPSGIERWQPELAKTQLVLQRMLARMMRIDLKIDETGNQMPEGLRPGDFNLFDETLRSTVRTLSEIEREIEPTQNRLTEGNSSPVVRSISAPPPHAGLSESSQPSTPGPRGIIGRILGYFWLFSFVYMTAPQTIGTPNIIISINQSLERRAV